MGWCLFGSCLKARTYCNWFVLVLVRSWVVSIKIKIWFAEWFFTVLLLLDPAIFSARSSPGPYVWHVAAFAKIRGHPCWTLWALDGCLNCIAQLFATLHFSTRAHAFALNSDDWWALYLDGITIRIDPGTPVLAHSRMLKSCCYGCDWCGHQCQFFDEFFVKHDFVVVF